MSSGDVCAKPCAPAGFMSLLTSLSLAAITSVPGGKLACCGPEMSSNSTSIQPAARLSVCTIVMPDLVFFAESAEVWPMQKIVSARTK